MQVAFLDEPSEWLVHASTGHKTGHRCWVSMALTASTTDFGRFFLGPSNLEFDRRSLDLKQLMEFEASLNSMEFHGTLGVGVEVRDAAWTDRS